jgi:hypothetical protein
MLLNFKNSGEIRVDLSRGIADILMGKNKRKNKREIEWFTEEEGFGIILEEIV